MAAHNQARMIGYLLRDPIVVGEENAQTIFFQIRTTHRDTTDYFNNRQFEDVTVYFNDNSNIKLMNKLKNLAKLDLVDIKGVFSVLTLNKESICPECHAKNIKMRGSATVIWPIDIVKRSNFAADLLRWEEQVKEYKELTKDEKEMGVMKNPGEEPIPEKVLTTHFKEISNQVIVLGTLVSDPESTGTEKNPCARYKIGIDRKFYIKTQSDITSDYPYIYSFGEQAKLDLRHLKKGSLILADTFLRTRGIKNNMQCEACGADYQFDDAAMELIPYAIEYVGNYITDEEIAKEEERKNRMEAEHAKRMLGM